VAIRFPDWIDWTGIALVLLVMIFAALLWIWWNRDDRH
jgi:hypothetical protein